MLWLTKGLEADLTADLYRGQDGAAAQPSRLTLVEGTLPSRICFKE